MDKGHTQEWGRNYTMFHLFKNANKYDKLFIWEGLVQEYIAILFLFLI